MIAECMLKLSLNWSSINKLQTWGLGKADNYFIVSGNWEPYQKSYQKLNFIKYV